MDWVTFWLIGAGIAAAIAGSRGRSALGWFVLSIIVSPLLGILAAMLLPAVDTRPHRTCPHCAENVLASASLCKHCGQPLPAPATKEISRYCQACGQPASQHDTSCQACGGVVG